MCRGTPWAGSSALREPRSFHDSAGWKGALARPRPRRNWFGLAEIIPLLGWCSLLTWSGAHCQCNSSPGSLAGVSSAQRGTPCPAAPNTERWQLRVLGAPGNCLGTPGSPGHPQLIWAPPAYLGIPGSPAYPWLIWTPTAHLGIPSSSGHPWLIWAPPAHLGTPDSPAYTQHTWASPAHLGTSSSPGLSQAHLCTPSPGWCR